MNYTQFRDLASKLVDSKMYAMELDDPKTNLWEKVHQKRKWCTNTKPKVYLLTGIGILVGFLFALLVFNKCVAVSEKRCTTHNCIIAASEIIKTIDMEINPCENFYKFACGGLLKRTYQDANVSPLKDIEDTIQRQRLQIMKEPIINDRDHVVVKNAKKLFAACIHSVDGDLEGFRKVLDKLGGWPVVKGLGWDEGHFDWKEMMHQLKEAGFSPDVFLWIRVAEDPINATQHILLLRKPRYVPFFNNGKVQYLQDMVETAVNFGAERDIANIEMGNTFAFIEKLQSILLKIYNETENTLFNRRKRIEEYQLQHDYINWLEYINNFLPPETQLKPSNYVLFLNDGYFSDLFPLLKKTSNRTIANYIFWNLVRRYLFYLPKNISDPANSLCTTNKYARPEIETCTNKLTNIFTINPFDIIYARRYAPKEKRNHVQNMLENIKVKLLEMLHVVPWMDKQTKRAAIEKSRAITESIGAPGDYFSDVVFDIIGRDMQELGNATFLEMSIQLSRRNINQMFDRLNTNSRKKLYTRFYNHVSSTFIYYDEENIIPISAGILQGLFLDLERPEYLNYGALGSLIAAQLIYAIDEEGGQFNENGEKKPIWTDNTLEAYEIVTQCIVHETESFDLEVTEKKLNGSRTRVENVANYASLKLSYSAYKQWVYEHGEEELLPGLNYNSYQLFWISTIAYQCHHSESEDLESAIAWHPVAPVSFRAFGPIRNNVNFAKDFNCPAGSRMNPKEKCEVF